MTQSYPETFHFMRWGFDIAALRDVLRRTSAPPEEIRVSVVVAAQLLESDPQLTPADQRVVPLVCVDVQWGHVDELPAEALGSPLFVAPMGAVGQLVIDGWHRIALARRRGVEELPGLLLTASHASRVLLKGSAELPSDPGRG
ncbi:hypothetical protein [Streptomyces sp. MMS24-I29]|uniref:hypothetical protein n=1 Tax=Streptomyces sp. MMS24-I29 TaxID=3351480 RepID=UPI003C7CD9DB